MKLLIMNMINEYGKRINECMKVDGDMNLGVGMGE